MPILPIAYFLLNINMNAEEWYYIYVRMFFFTNKINHNKNMLFI